LSRADSAQIVIDPLCQDKHGKWVRFEYEIERKDLERLLLPYIVRSVNICRKVMEEKNLSSGDFEKLILVGGPTLTPMLRQMLSEKLGIPLEFRVDPLTVVARGAAIFAGTQRFNRLSGVPVGKGQYEITLEYRTIDTDPEPLVGGKVLTGDGKAPEGFTVEFIESKSQWRSGKITVSPNGGFITNLRAEKGRKNEFLIELRNVAGILCEAVPDRISYTIGLPISNPPLINSVGIALANNEMQIFLKKGTPLPARRREIHRTTAGISKGQSATFIRIPVVEGENVNRSDRNRKIGDIVISGDKIARDVPAGSEVEITIQVDESRIVSTRAYIPILDKDYDGVLKLEKDVPDPQVLSDEFGREKKRLDSVRARARETGDLKAADVLQKIDGEQMVHDVEASLAAAFNDRDSADKCQNRLLDMKSAIDRVEDSLEWPNLVKEAGERLSWAKGVVKDSGKGDDQRTINVLEKEAQEAIASCDEDVLRRKINDINALGWRILLEKPDFWVGYLQYLTERKMQMKDRGQADQLIGQGTRAINTNDLEGLKAAVRQLINLLPVDEQQDARGYGGTTMPF